MVAAGLGLAIAFVLAESPSEADPRRLLCAPGMVEVVGDYCPELEHVCASTLPPERGGPVRCAEYAPTSKCRGRSRPKHFCIDRFEFPNERGKNPVVMKSWREAKDACRALGKRLCTDSEWTLACEGGERVPYPYGRKRDETACNIDKPHVDVDEAAILAPKKRAAEIARLWQGEASGAREACVSPFGVFDMTGNVDEWVVNESGTPYDSGLKGGYWGRVRAACRPMTTAHGEKFPFYQTGFRCCADVPAER